MREAIRHTLSNRPFRMVMGLYLLSWTTASILAATLVYFANYYLRVPDQANYFVLAAQGSAILFIPAVVWLCQRLDKRRAFILGSCAWVVVLLGISALRADQVGLAYVLAALAGFGIATAYVVPWSMVPDVVEYDQVRSGQRREGSYYAFASFFQKLATGAALWGMGQALALTGYLTPVTGVTLAGTARRSGDGHPHLHRPDSGGAAVLGRAVRVEVPDYAGEPSGDVAGVGGARGIGQRVFEGETGVNQRIFTIVIVILLVSCSPRDETLFQEAATPDRSYPQYYALIFDGQVIVVTWNNNIPDRPKDSQREILNLTIGEDYLLIDELWYGEFNNDLVIVYETTNFDYSTSYTSRMDIQDKSTVWLTPIRTFNLGEPMIHSQHLYVTAIGLVAKLDLKTGEYIWKHSGLYNKQTRDFNDFDKPIFDEGRITFKGTIILAILQSE